MLRLEMRREAGGSQRRRLTGRFAGRPRMIGSHHVRRLRWTSAWNTRCFRLRGGSSAAVWLYGVIGVLVFGVGALVSTEFLFGSRLVTIELSDQGVRVRGDMYGRDIPRTALRAERARSFNLVADPGLRAQDRLLAALKS
jgi:hypothetical protein